MITKYVGGDALMAAGVKNDIEFWSKISGLSTTSATSTDHMVAALGRMGYTGTPDDMFRAWAQSLGSKSWEDNLRAFFQLPISTMTFYKNFMYSQTKNADYSVGSPTGTFTRTTGDVATYVDSNGVIQLAGDTLPRFQGGYYDATGFHAQSGLMIQAAGTNLVTYSTFSNGTTVATGWTEDNDVTGTPTCTVIPETLTNISGSKAQRIVYSSVADTGTYIQLYQLTGAASFAPNDYATISVWAKGTIANAEFRLSFTQKDSSDVSGTVSNSSDFASALSSTEWRRFTFPKQLTDADLDHVSAKILFSAIAGDVAIDLQFAAIQVEKSPYATSFIPTTTAAATRNAETLTFLTAGNRTAATESIFISFVPEYDGTALSASSYLMSTDTKQRILAISATTDKIIFRPNGTDNGTSSVTGTTVISANTQYVVAGIAYSATGNPNTGIYINGTDVTSDAATSDWTVPEWGTKFYIGSDKDGAQIANCLIKQIAIFSDAKNSTQVPTITSILPS